MRTPEELLRAAADYLEEHGWIKGEGIRADGAACALGAIWAVGGSGLKGLQTPEETAAKELLVERIAATGYRSYGGEPTCVPSWNDELGRTQAEVIAVLRGVA